MTPDKCEYLKLLDWRYAEEARLQAEFIRQVEALRASCPHEKSTGWLCDYNGTEATLCLRCMVETARRNGGPRLL